MGSIKQINIEVCPYYFFDDMFNVKNFDPNLLRIDKISFKSTDTIIYNIRYIAMRSIDVLIMKILILFLTIHMDTINKVMNINT